ncbi:NF-kappa-B-repressing factor-like isoform X2 [Melanaphis sacchari]|uniref:NF-kappa-B-repressing factor-like isoform X2 n=1 Tax=Melanaphis sacchari TaxID=742174 RepID=UPI000DC13867|nr:NF-kappa-B-repressing factor-like isoform X2 [Melanaphis sacchari]
MYPKPTMDLIGDLSKSFVNNLREKMYENQQITNTTYVNYVKAIENVQAVTFKLNINQPPKNKMRYTTPFDFNCLIPGFMLKIPKNDFNHHKVIKRSCYFSQNTKLEIEHEELDFKHNQAKLYLQWKLIAVGAGTTRQEAIKNVTSIAFKILKEMCFTVTIKKNDTHILWTDLFDDSSEKVPNFTKHHNTISSNNFGFKILKRMGWKEGDGLGKNNQGIKSAIIVVPLKKRAGLGATKRTPQDIYVLTEVKKRITEFLSTSNSRITFAINFPPSQRTYIQTFCKKKNLKVQHSGDGVNYKMFIEKQQTTREVYDILINCINFENDMYILEPPLHESINDQ